MRLLDVARVFASGPDPLDRRQSAERKNSDCQVPVTAERQGESADDHDEEFQHAADRGCPSAKFNSDAFADGRCSSGSPADSQIAAQERAMGQEITFLWR